MNTRAGMRIGRIVTPGLTGIGFFLSSFMLRRKGYRVVGQIPFDMPSNWISIHPALGGKSVKLIHEKNYQRVKEHVDKLCSGKKDFASRKDTIQDVLISPVAFAYYTIGRYFFAKSYYASPACTHCDLCIKQCPVQAIKKVDNRPFWTFKCESCMKCMNNCPTKAIETTHGIWIVAGILASSLCTYLFYSWLPIAIQSGFVKLLLFSLVLIALIGVFYRIQQLLLRSRFAGKLISLASLTRYKFWGRYRSIPDDR